MPVVRRTRATLRSAELGFFGVMVKTRVQTPRRWGEPRSAGLFVFACGRSRPLLTSCWTVGIALSSALSLSLAVRPLGESDKNRAEARPRDDRNAVSLGALQATHDRGSALSSRKRKSYRPHPRASTRRPAQTPGG